MAKKPTGKGLGRGLSALLGDIEDGKGGIDTKAPAAFDDKSPRDVTSVPIERLRPNPEQPRRDFSDPDLEELATSVRERGIIQPIIVRPDPTHKGDYQIVAGERRWRAAQKAQLHELPVVVRDFDDQMVLEVGIIENVQRTDLNPIEEALGYSLLMERHEYTQDGLARVVGKSRSHLANCMRLLNLPEEVKAMLRNNTLTAGHARALINAADPLALAKDAIAKGLSVRQVEQLARKVAAPVAQQRQNRSSEKDADTRALEGDLSAAIGMRCSIEDMGKGGGELRIRYQSLEDLDRLCQKLAE
ncbi:MAG: ParB/RepB/Spo0J family partition protein [Pseudomonadota bacterium]